MNYVNVPFLFLVTDKLWNQLNHTEEQALWHKIKYSIFSHIPLFERIDQIKCFLQQLSPDIQTYIDTDRHENPITISSKSQTSTHVLQKKA